jgi:hypothetical protein
MTTSRRKEGESGAVLVFALLILVSAAVIFAGLAQMSATQALVGGREWEEARQRITLANSRALARGFLLSRIFWNDGINGLPTNPATFPSFPNTNFGGFSITNNSVADFWAAMNSATPSTNLGINPFSPFERGGFYPATIRANLWDGTEATNSWNFQVRLRSPIAAGYTLIRHAPNATTNKASNSINTFYRPGMFFRFPDIPGVAVSSVTNTNRDTNGYVGFLGAPLGVSGRSFAGAELKIPSIPSPTNAYVDIYLTNAVDDLYFYDVPATHTNSVGAILPLTEVRLFGDTNELAPPFVVRVAATNGNLRKITLANNNTRPVCVYVDSDSAGSTRSLDISSTANIWRASIYAKLPGFGPILAFSLPNPAFRLLGGVRTDALISNAPTILTETNPAGLDFIADKMMWLEDARARQ